MKYVKDIMSSPVTNVTLDETVQQAAVVMGEKGIGSVAVMKGDVMLGIVTERDISKKVVAQNKDASRLSVQDIMQSEIVTAKPDTTIDEASTIMSEGKFRRLPIMENGKLVGIVTETDLELALREEAIDETKARVRDHYVFAEQIRNQENRIEELKNIINNIETSIK